MKFANAKRRATSSVCGFRPRFSWTTITPGSFAAVSVRVSALNGRTKYERTKPFAQAVAQALEQAEPDLVVSKMTKKLRVGKVLVDWSQNTRSKTTVSVYSLRARERPTISTPVTWDEVEAGAKGKTDLRFEADDVLKRIEKHGDLFAPVLELKQTLPRGKGPG